MYDIFISYSHSHTAEKAEHLLTILENRGFADKVSLDKDNLVGKFDVEILRRIDNCKDVIIVIGEQTFRNLNPDHAPYYKMLANCPIGDFYTLLETLPFRLDYLRLELARAIAQNKNIIPVAPAKTPEYNFDDLGDVLPDDVKLLVKFQAVFYDDKGSLTFQDIVEAKIIGKNNKTLLTSVPKFRNNNIKPWKVLLVGLAVLLFIALGALVFREHFAYQRCRTIADYDAFIATKPLFYGGKADSDRRHVENMLGFDGVAQEIQDRVSSVESLKSISLRQAEAMSSILTNMVYVKGGTFMMGSDDANSKEAPRHRVNVDDFYISRYECSVEEWCGILDIACDGYHLDSLSAPKVNISWNDAVTFVAKLNQILPGLHFALPHEKEWEYAATGGHLYSGYVFSGGNDPTDVAWTLEDSLDAPQVRPSDGISWWRESNELGIFNMSGNVAEFCENRFYYYSSPDKDFPMDMKVIRGGSFLSEANRCKVYSRDLVSTEAFNNGIGFRLVLRIN